jgi:hypothetical protein
VREVAHVYKSTMCSTWFTLIVSAGEIESNSGRRRSLDLMTPLGPLWFPRLPYSIRRSPRFGLQLPQRNATGLARVPGAGVKSTDN